CSSCRVSAFFLLFFSRSGAHRALPSFPTRRSSDLAGALDLLGSGGRGRPGPVHLVGAAASHIQIHPGSGERVGERSEPLPLPDLDRKSTRLNSSHVKISYAVFCLKKKKKYKTTAT